MTIRPSFAALMLLACVACVVASGCAQRRSFKMTRVTEVQQEKLDAASAAKSSGDYDEALTLFRDILSDNPTVVPAYLGIGDIYMVQKEYDRAEPAYARAARYEPENFDAQYGHGLALQMLNRFAEAIRAYQRALLIEPDDPKANLNLATVHLQMNEARNALPYARIAVLADPGSGPARVNLGAIYEQLGRNSQAIEQYLAALELMEPSEPLMMNLISVLAKEQRYEEAVSTAENLVRLVPSANAYERLGWAYFRLKDYDRSMQAYRDAVGIDANHWPSLNGIGVNALNKWLLSKRRDQQALGEARTAFRRSLQIEPGQLKLVTLMSNYDL